MERKSGSMKGFDQRIGWGILLVALGILFLLQTMGLLVGGWGWIIAPLFVAAGGIFVYMFVANPEQWWAVIPGFALAGLGILIGLASLPWELGGILGAAVFMASLGLAFWVVYLRNRKWWWAVIPGGVLGSLALVILASEFLGGTAAGGILFLGMGATFALVHLLPTGESETAWALIPAAILGGIGLLLFLAAMNFFIWLFPLALIGLGAYVILRAFVRNRE